MSLPVLVVGATGALGKNIVKALLLKGDQVKVSVLVRDIHKLPKEWENKVQAFMGDLTQPDSLRRALQEQKAVISVVQGGRNVVIDGQKNLLEAIKESGSVKHFFPSTFALDLFQLSGNLAPLGLALRCEFAEYLSANKGDIKITHILNGGFVEAVFGNLEILDFKTNTIRIWGDGNTKFDITTLEDTGRFTAEALLDPNVGERFECHGEEISLNELAERLEKALGVELKRDMLGTVEELKTMLEKKLSQDPNAHLPEQYMLPLVSGVGKLHNVQNSKYPNLKPKSLEQYIAEFRKVSPHDMQNPDYVGRVKSSN